MRAMFLKVCISLTLENLIRGVMSDTPLEPDVSQANDVYAIRELFIKRYHASANKAACLFEIAVAYSQDDLVNVFLKILECPKFKWFWDRELKDAVQEMIDRYTV